MYQFIQSLFSNICTLLFTLPPQSLENTLTEKPLSHLHHPPHNCIPIPNVRDEALIVSQLILVVRLDLHLSRGVVRLSRLRSRIQSATGSIQSHPLLRGTGLSHQRYHTLGHFLTLLFQNRMPLCVTGWIQVDFQEIDLFPSIQEKIKAEEFEAALLVLHLGGEDAIGNDMVDLLCETTSKVAQGRREEIFEHHDGLGLIRIVPVFEDTVIGQMDLLIQFGEGKRLMREAAVASMVPVYDWFALKGRDQHPLPDVEFLSGKFLWFLEDIGIADVLLDDLVFVLFPVFELAPHVVRIDAELFESFDEGDAGTTGTGDGLDDPEGSSLVVGLVQFREEFVVMEYQDEQSIVNIIERQRQVLQFMALEVEKGLLDEGIVKMLLGSEVKMLIRLKCLKVGCVPLMSADLLEIHAQFNQHSCLFITKLED